MRSINYKIGCEKIAFPSKDAAIKKMHDIKNKSDREKLPTRVYQCPVCKQWHMTSNELAKAAKGFHLSKQEQWNALMEKQDARDVLYSESPFERQLKRAKQIICHNINVQCQLIDQRFKYRDKNLRNSFNSKQNKLIKRLEAI